MEYVVMFNVFTAGLCAAATYVAIVSRSYGFAVANGVFCGLNIYVALLH